MVIASEIAIKTIPIEDIGRYVGIAFDGDNELVEKFHKADKTLEETIAGNIKNINELAGKIDLKCFVVYWGDNEIGFFVMAYHNSMLYSFGINKKYRVKNILLDWWGSIKALVGEYLICPLNSENTRAINFFVRNGMQVLERDKSIVTLIYKK